MFQFLNGAIRITSLVLLILSKPLFQFLNGAIRIVVLGGGIKFQFLNGAIINSEMTFEIE